MSDIFYMIEYLLIMIILPAVAIVFPIYCGSIISKIDRDLKDMKELLLENGYDEQIVKEFNIQNDDDIHIKGMKQLFKVRSRLNKIIVLYFITIFFSGSFLQDIAYIPNVGKPVIYMYGYDGDVDVDLDMNGKMTCCYPVYDNGWHMSVSSDSTFCDDDGRKYGYLYYECNVPMNKDDLFKYGWCVKGRDTVSFLEDVLTKYGLTDKEQDDFITYWLPKMQDNKYNVISFVQDEYDERVKLNVNPQPDNVIRVIMCYYGSDEFVDIKAPVIKDNIDRDGITVVEWGGFKI